MDIAHLRLHNQQIAHSTFRTPGQLVAHLGAVQAQDYAGAKWAIALRLPSATEADVERAIAERAIVRTWPMRRTLHFVAAGDVRWMLALTASRAEARFAPRYRQLGLDDDTFRRSADVLVKALSGGRSLSRPAVYRLLEGAGIGMSGGGPLDSGQTRGLHILAHHAHTALICYGLHEGKQPAVVLLDEWAPKSRTLDRDEAVAELARRYFTSHGPATLQDFIWWSGQTVRDAKAGLESAGRHLVREVFDGKAYWHPPSAPSAREPSPAAYLLPPFDEYTVAYRDRSAVLDPRFAKQASNGGIFKPIIVVDGRVAGTWKVVVTKDALVITAMAFAKLGKAEQRAIRAAAERYGAFRDMPVSLAHGDS